MKIVAIVVLQIIIMIAIVKTKIQMRISRNSKMFAKKFRH